MSLGWKKFSFFEQAELDQQGLPEDLTCGAAGPDNALFLGSGSGLVSIMDPSLALRTSFQAHQHTIVQLTYLEVGRFLAIAVMALILRYILSFACSQLLDCEEIALLPVAYACFGHPKDFNMMFAGAPGLRIHFHWKQMGLRTPELLHILPFSCMNVSRCLAHHAKKVSGGGMQAKKTLVTLGLEDVSHQSATLKVWLCNNKGRLDRTASAVAPPDPAQPAAPMCLKTIKVSSTLTAHALLSFTGHSRKGSTHLSRVSVSPSSDDAQLI